MPRRTTQSSIFAAHNRDIARVITRRFFLFVGRFVFFIDDDQPEIFQRREDRAARADDDARASRLNLVPFVVAFAFRQDGYARLRPCPAFPRNGF